MEKLYNLVPQIGTSIKQRKLRNLFNTIMKFNELFNRH